MDEGFQSSNESDSSIQQEQPLASHYPIPDPNPLLAWGDDEISPELPKSTQLLPLFRRHNIAQRSYQKHALIKNKHQIKFNFNGSFIPIDKLATLSTNAQSDCTIGTINSNFQSGNLFAAYQVSDDQYDLILENDINSYGYTQWFYFYVSNLKQIPLTFNILNMAKRYKHLDHEFSIFIKYPDKQWEILKQGSVKQRKSIYGRMQYRSPQCSQLYQMQIKVNSPQSYYLALNIPFTLDDLDRYLSQSAQLLCTTIGGNPIHYLEFGQRDKDVIIMLARQHPGETVSSHVCQGFIEAIKYNNQLSQQFNILIFPMMNPDGVKQGNFRCDLSGVDLNRIWNKPNKEIHKQIYELKCLISSILKSGRDVKCFIDLHGHSSKLNSFVYACRGDQDPIVSRVLPYIMQQQSKYFSMKDCTFHIEAHKMKTARATVFKMLKHNRPKAIHNVITLETSFFGFEEKQQQIQFTLNDLYRIGSDLYKSLIVYYNDKQLIQSIQNTLEQYRSYYDIEDCKQDMDMSDSEPDKDLMETKQIRRLYNTFISSDGRTKPILQQIPTNLNKLSRQSRQQQYQQDRIITQVKEQQQHYSYSPEQFTMKINRNSQYKEVNSPRQLLTKYRTQVTQQSDIHTSQEGNLVFSLRYPPNGTTNNNKLNNDKQVKGATAIKQQPQLENRRYQSVTKQLAELNQQVHQQPIILSRSVRQPQDRRLIFEFSSNVKRKNTQRLMRIVKY